MKQKLHMLFCSVGLILGSCYMPDESESPPEPLTDERFSLDEARSYFEQTADDLCPMNLYCKHDHSSDTKSDDEILNMQISTTMTPLWNNAIYTYDNGHTMTIEIPIDMHTTGWYAWSSILDSCQAKYAPRLTSNLVIQKDLESNQKRYFIATFIPTRECHRVHRMKVMQHRFMMNPDYEGYVILSDAMTGKCLTSYRRHNGIRTDLAILPVTGMDSSELAGLEIIDRLGLAVSRMSFMTKSDGSELGGQDANCPFCHAPLNGNLTCPNGCEVLVVGQIPVCESCGHPENQCVCCVICGGWPCMCYNSNNPPYVNYGCTDPNCVYFPFCDGVHGGGGGGGTTGGGTYLSAEQRGAVDVDVRDYVNYVHSHLPNNTDIKEYLDNVWNAYRYRINCTMSKLISVAGLQFKRDSTNVNTVEYYDIIFSTPAWHLLMVKSANNTERQPAKVLMVIHELYHIVKFEKAGYVESSNQDLAIKNHQHHVQMVDDPEYEAWIKALLPGYTEEEYDAFKYAGTLDSDASVFNALPFSTRNAYETIFDDYNIYF